MASGETTSDERPNKLWYLLPILLGIIGGVIGYFVLKDRNRKFAEHLLIAGLVMSVVLSGIVFTAALYALGVFTPGKARVPCSPCFGVGDFAFVDYSGGTLILSNGPREITINTVTATPDNPPAVSFSPTIRLPPATNVIIAGIDTRGDVQLVIKYTSGTGLQKQDTATIHN